MKKFHLCLYVFTFLLGNVMSQMNISESKPDIRIKYEIINETLFCISTYGEGYSPNLISFARENRTIDENFNFDELYEFALSDDDMKLIKKCRRRAYYNTIFPDSRKDGDLVYCGLNANSNEDYNDNPNNCRISRKNYSQYTIFKQLKRRRMMDLLKK